MSAVPSRSGIGFAGFLCVSVLTVVAACAARRAPEVTIGAAPNPVVHVGDMVRLPLPRPDIRWEVEFDRTNLRAISGQDQPSPPEGWKWEAIAPGKTQVVLNGRPACAQPPCPPQNVPRIVIDLEIVKP